MGEMERSKSASRKVKSPPRNVSGPPVPAGAAAAAAAAGVSSVAAEIPFARLEHAPSAPLLLSYRVVG